MKFHITFKDPDGVYDSLSDAGIDINEMDTEVEWVVDKFLDYKEYVTIELDTETQTARVIPT